VSTPVHLRIFLSSPADVATERQVARDLFKKLAVDPSFRGRLSFDVIAWDDPHAAVAMPAHLTPQLAVARGLPTPSECDIVIIILWSRMGTPLPPECKKPDGSPYRSGTEWEYCEALLSARNSGKPTILLYRRVETPIIALTDPSFEERRQQFAAVAAFFDEMKSSDGSLVGSTLSYETPEQFSAILEQNLRSILDQLLSTSLTSIAKPMRGAVPFQAPPPPSYYVERPEILSGLKGLLGPSRAGGNTFVIGALHGLGGIGKTAAVSRLCYDEEIQHTFSDGILWATLGQQPDLLFWLTSWVHALGDFDYRAHDVISTSLHLRSLVQRKKLLFIVDDVWKTDHARPFLLGGGDSRLIITTRRRDLADELGAVSHSLDLMNEVEAVTLLQRRIAHRRLALNDSMARELVKAVDYLPLAVEILAAQVLRNLDPSELLRKLRQETARLEALSTPRERRSGLNRIEACFNLSLDTLRTQDQDAWLLFVYLGLLPEDAIIESHVVANLFQKTRKTIEDLLQVLLDDSLLMLSSSGFEPSHRYRMHDLLHDISRTLIERPAPEGLGLSMVQMHRELLERLHRGVPSGMWSSIPADGYIERHLVWHMLEADKMDCVHCLFSERTASGRLAWMATREKWGQFDGFISDLRAVFAKCLETLAQQNKSSAQSAELLLLCIRYIFIYSTVVSRASTMPAEYLEIMVMEKLWTPKQALSYASHMLSREQRFEAYSFLMPYQDESTRKNYEAEQLKDLSRERSKGERWSSSTINFKQLGSQIQDAILKLISEEGNDYGIPRVEAERLARLAPYFDSDRRAALFQKFATKTDPLSKIILLSAIANDSHVTQAGHIVFEAYDMIDPKSSRWAKDYALACLLPLLSSSDRATAVRYLMEQVQGYTVSGRIARRIVPFADATQINLLLKCRMEQEDETYRAIGERIAAIGASLKDVAIQRPRHRAIAHCSFYKQRKTGSIDDLTEIVNSSASDLGDWEVFGILVATITFRSGAIPTVIVRKLNDQGKKICGLVSLAFSEYPLTFESPIAKSESQGLSGDGLFEWNASTEFDALIRSMGARDFESGFFRLIKEIHESRSIPFHERHVHERRIFYEKLKKLVEAFDQARDGAMLAWLCTHLRIEHAYALVSALHGKFGRIDRKALFVGLETIFAPNLKLDYDMIERGDYRYNLEIAWLTARRQPRRDLIQLMILCIVAMEDRLVEAIGTGVLNMCAEFSSNEPV
jgi:hypothetical protein